jgi:hypothetical protein
MSAHQRLRTMIVALFGVATLTLGPVALLAPTAAATPGGPAVTQVGDSPFDGMGADDAPKKEGTPKKDEKADKAEKLGGGIAGKVIDMAGNIAKCALNIATPSVKCQL